MESPYIPIQFRNAHPSPEEVAAVQSFVSFLEVFRKGDVKSLQKYVLPEGRATNIRPHRPEGIIQASLIGLIERVSHLAPDQKPAEPLYDVEVWVDRQMAIAWTPYDFYLAKGDEMEMTHVGTDIVFFAKLDGEWKISGLADNCRVVTERGRIPHRYEGPEFQDPEEEKAILGVFQQVIDTMRTHEFERIHGLLLPGTVFTFHRGDQVDFVTPDEFINICHETLEGKESMEELLDVRIRIDDDVAMIWTPFKFTVGQDVNFGSDMVTLAKVDGKWLVTGFAVV
jgi:hypothetical protein